MYRSLSLLASSIALCACGGGDGNSSTTNPNQGMSVDEYGTLIKPVVEPKVLKPATEDELLTLIKNGVRNNVYIGSVTAVDTPASDAFNGIEVADVTLRVEAEGGEFSSTNTHVRGVDESDFMKYDGQYLYMTTHPEYIWGQDLPQAEIRIMETDPTNAAIAEVGSIPLKNDIWGEVSELYLVTDDDSTRDLVTLRSSWNYIAAAEPTLAAFDFWPGPIESKIQLTAYNVEDPASPAESFSVQIDGFLQNSRKIDNTLYLVTQYSPHLPSIQYFFDSEDEAQENEDKIADLTLEDLLPSISINGGDETPLFAAEDCLIPVDLTSRHGYHNMVSLVAIDLESQEVTSARCLSTQVQGIYATANSLYIGGSSVLDWQNFESYTAIHKFELGDDILYRATAVVPGTLGWQDPSFRMDEHDELLRVVTTLRTQQGLPDHRLTILRDSDTTDEMTVVSQLPNDSNPAPIGKPNEDIFAVRFLEDRAFIVTFERIDPLYVLDLANAEAPRIAGELEVPGFSTYLHPVGENYLLGIGQDADDAGIAQGIKVSLYDVSDMSAPSLINDEIFGDRGTWSMALYDLRAISFLMSTDDQLRFAFPTSVYSSPWTWEEESLQLFEINGLATDSADLSFVGKIVSESSDGPNTWPSWSGTDRSVLDQEAIYYTHGNSVWASFWSSPEAATGPH